jgi:hypothetical protein
MGRPRIAFTFGLVSVVFLFFFSVAKANDFIDSDRNLFWDAARLKVNGDYAAALASINAYIDQRTKSAFPNDILLAAALRERALLDRITATNRNDIASLWMAISIDSEALGRDHPLVSYDYVAIADGLAAKGKLDEAQNYYLQASIIVMHAFGPFHPYTEALFRKIAPAFVLRLVEARDKTDDGTTGRHQISDAMAMAKLSEKEAPKTHSNAETLTIP